MLCNAHCELLNWTAHNFFIVTFLLLYLTIIIKTTTTATAIMKCIQWFVSNSANKTRSNCYYITHPVMDMKQTKIYHNAIISTEMSNSISFPMCGTVYIPFIMFPYSIVFNIAAMFECSNLQLFLPWTVSGMSSLHALKEKCKWVFH